MNEYMDMIVSGETPDITTISECHDMMIRAFDTVHIFRTDTEMRGGILNPLDYPTHDAKYWQAIRELTVMSENLAENEFSLREVDLELQLLKLDLDEIDTVNARGKLQHAQKQVEIDRVEFKRALINREISRRIAEIQNWTRIIRELEPLLACGTTDPGRHQLITYIVEFSRKLIAARSVPNPDPESIQINFAKLGGMVNEIQRQDRIGELKAAVRDDEHLRSFLNECCNLEVCE